MKALLLAAGLGTRIREIAPNTPKPLLEIGGVPLLKLLIDKLFNLGVHEIIINTHFLNEQIEDFVSNEGYGKKVQLVFEPELLGTAGTLKKNLLELAESDFFVLHADNFFEDSLETMLEQHKTSGPDVLMSMGTIVVKDPKNFGTLKVNSQGIVTEYLEKDPQSPHLMANTAIYIMKTVMAEKVRSLMETESDISRDLIPKLVNNIQAIPLRGYFLDIGTPENYTEANKIQTKLF
jgi:mannose-1-phosphate guanylyltransferase